MTVLRDMPVGSIVKLKVNGNLREFIIIHQGRPSTLYDASCDGTWLLMRDIFKTSQWHNSEIVNYASSDIHSYLNFTWLGNLDTDNQPLVKRVKIPYHAGNGKVNSGADGLSCRVFLLSANEVGLTGYGIPTDGEKLDYFDSGYDSEAKQKRIAKYDGSILYWWLRSSRTNSTIVPDVGQDGGFGGSAPATGTSGVRPALVLYPHLLVSYDGSVTSNTSPTTPSSITIPTSISGGTSITISWGASSDAEGNLEGYIVQRSIDGGSSWAQIYQGSGRSTTNSVAFGTASVMYRVKAYDSAGLESGWRTSSQVTVTNNRAPGAPASITVPNVVKGGASITVSWGAATDSDGNLSGYILERQAAGGSWTQVYKGSGRSYTDTITKGWASVAYRVKAYDSYDAVSAYTTSPTRTVDNNTAPVITCASPTGSDLGTKTAGFAVAYTVTDVDNDQVAVTEALDGNSLRSFTASLGTENNLDLTGEAFMKVLNGSHTLKITAADPKVSTAHSLTFTKSVTAASVTLAEPMEADAAITLCVLSVTGSIPADAAYKVEVTNNAKDPAPVWEDCTAAVKAGANYIFTNTATPANGPAFNFRITVSRGESGQGGYINSVQGGFQ